MKRARSWKMSPQELHLVRQDFPALQIDVLGMGRDKRHRNQLHSGLFRCPAGLEVVAADTGGDDIVPVVRSPLAEWGHMVPGKLVCRVLLPAVQAQVGITLEKRGIVQGRPVVLPVTLPQTRPMGGDDGVHLQDTWAPGQAVVPAVYHHGKFTTGIGHLAQAHQRHRTPEVDPFKRHA